MINRILKTKVGAIFGALICTLLWGTAFPVIKLCYNHLGIESGNVGAQVLFAGERFFIAGAMVFAFCLIFKRQSLKISGSAVLPVLSLGLVQTAMQYFCSYIGVANTTGTKTSVITACSAFFAVLLAPLFFRNEKVGTSKLVGCALGLAGVIIININGIADGGISFLGEGMVLLSALCSGAGSFLSKASALKSDAVAVTAYQLLFGGALLILSGTIMGGNILYSDIAGVLLLLYLAFVSAVAFALWTALLGLHSVGRICIFNLLIPIFGTVWSGILLGEQILKWENLASLILVAIGIFLVNYSREEKKE
ncbi:MULTISPECIES: DMT family transporter [unclassified Ruminococcus]|uniref:DMT family transporter n=1 Tax=unclassified Ruminococcus TaxID=2608920 RepID=UPI00210D2CE6|nr:MULTISPECIES: DMT family transporter [unclassified Ruminococcus]MCQ4021993.1 EamA family transporter [Ruminococcus sp. zg-924]MCQ4114529.1 EamA family transporter [Ruminococcus sp. zg-921]